MMRDGNPIGSIGMLNDAMATSASAMRAQATRLRVVAENLANANSTAATPGGDPYRRKTISFEQALDRRTGASLVRPGAVSTDPAPFRTVYDPSHPAADKDGYVKMPNISEALEAADMRESERSYEANVTALTQARAMIAKTLDILKA